MRSSLCLLALALVASLAPASAWFEDEPAERLPPSNEAAFKATISEVAVDYVRKNILWPMLSDMRTDLMAENHALKIPSSQRSFKFEGLGVTWAWGGLSKLKITKLSFNEDKTRVDFLSKSRLKVKVTDVHVELKASGNLMDHQMKVEAEIGDADLWIILTLGENKGYPTVVAKSGGLSIDEDKLRVHITKGLGWLKHAVNKVSDWCTGFMKDGAQAAFKSNYKKMNPPLSKALKSIQLTHTIKDADIPAVRLSKAVVARLGLHGKPLTTDGMISLFLDAHTYVQGKSACHASCKPRTTPNVRSPRRFVEISITDQLPCCALNAFHELGIMRFEGALERPMVKIPGDFAAPLDPVIDALMARYEVSYTVEAVAAPKVTFSTLAGAGVEARIKAQVHLDDRKTGGPNANPDLVALEAEVTVKAKAKASISGTKVEYSLESANLKLERMESFLPELTEVVKLPLQDLIDVVIQEKVLPQANEMMSKGYELPVVQGFSFVRPHLAIADNRLTVATDFSYAAPGEDELIDFFELMLQNGEGPPEEPIVEQPEAVVAGTEALHSDSL